MISSPGILCQWVYDVLVPSPSSQLHQERKKKKQKKEAKKRAIPSSDQIDLKMSAKSLLVSSQMLLVNSFSGNRLHERLQIRLILLLVVFPHLHSGTVARKSPDRVTDHSAGLGDDDGQAQQQQQQGFSPSLEALSPPNLIIPTSTFGKTSPKILDLPSHGGPVNVSASFGRTAFLKCKISDLGHKSVSWIRHNDVGLISVGKYQYIQDDRFKILHEPQSQEWVLRIQAVKYSDQGLYECQVNTSPMLRKAIYLTIVDPFPEILGGRDIFIDQHSTINLTCIVHSPDPPAHVFWLHNDKPLRQVSQLLTSRSGSSQSDPVSDRIHISHSPAEGSRPTVSYLIISEARPADSGQYLCNPSNTNPARVSVHVLTGESTDALQTSGLSTFSTSSSHSFLLIASIVTGLLGPFMAAT